MIFETERMSRKLIREWRIAEDGVSWAPMFLARWGHADLESDDPGVSQRLPFCQKIIHQQYPGIRREKAPAQHDGEFQ